MRKKERKKIKNEEKEKVGEKRKEKKRKEILKGENVKKKKK